MTPSAPSPREPKRRAAFRTPAEPRRPAPGARPPASRRGRPAAEKSAASPPPEAAVDPAVMPALRAVLEAYAPALVVQRDEARVYELATAKPYQGKPMFFGAVAARKEYVSFHLMPIHVFPELLEGISPGLRERLDGKSRFNFRSVNLELLRELAGLTAAGLDLFQQADLA